MNRHEYFANELFNEKKLEFLENCNVKQKEQIEFALQNGVNIDSFYAIGLIQNGKISDKFHESNVSAAIFALSVCKNSVKIAEKLLKENFSEKQLNYIIAGLLMPSFNISEQDALRILKVDSSADEILEKLIRAQTSYK